MSPYLDDNDRIVRLRGDLATDAILGLEFTLHHPQHQTIIQTQRQETVALRKTKSTSTIQGPTRPIF